MKKVAISTIFVVLFILVLSTCASVNTQGINYFVGKSESDLIKHFGYNGVVQTSTKNNENEKIVFFTNKVIKYQVSRVNTVQYKVSRQTQIMLLSFNEFSDGCLVELPSPIGYGMHIYIDGSIGGSTYARDGKRVVKTGGDSNVVHRNNNAILVPKINQFNNTINRYTSYSKSQENDAFNRSKIGDSYYIYNKESKTNWNPGVTEDYIDETYNNRSWSLSRIDIVAEDRSETESYIIGQYYERQDKYYSGNGNSVITVPQINKLIADYKSKGFTYTTRTEGNSLLAYIKNGKVVKVEEKKENK